MVPDPEDKFWRSPDLLVQLLTFLDVSSTLALAKEVPLLLDLLQRKFIWKDFINRSNIDGDKELEENKTEVSQIVEILKMMEDAEPLLQELLEVICLKFEKDFGIDELCITMSCKLHADDHDVAPDGFQLLELAEGMMGTNVQQVESIRDYGDYDDSSDILVQFVQAMAARLSRPTEKPVFGDTGSVHMRSATGLYAFLLQNTETWDWIKSIIFNFKEDFKEESWTWFVKGMQRNEEKIEDLWLKKKFMTKAKKEDLKAVWDAMSNDGRWVLSEGRWLTHHPLEEREIVWRDDIEERDGQILDFGWMRIEEIWDMERNEEEDVQKDNADGRRSIWSAADQIWSDEIDFDDFDFEKELDLFREQWLP